MKFLTTPYSKNTIATLCIVTIGKDSRQAALSKRNFDKNNFL